jgi:hypothetical protein
MPPVLLSMKTACSCAAGVTTITNNGRTWIVQDVLLRIGSGRHAEHAQCHLLLAKMCGADVAQRGISPDRQDV